MHECHIAHADSDGYQVCLARTVHLNRAYPGMFITINGKRARSSLPRAVYPQATTVHGDKCRDQIFQRHRIDATKQKSPPRSYVDYHPQEPVFDIFACHQNHRHDSDSTIMQESRAGKRPVAVQALSPVTPASACSDGHARQDGEYRGSIYRASSNQWLSHMPAARIAFGSGGQRILKLGFIILCFAATTHTESHKY